MTEGTMWHTVAQWADQSLLFPPTPTLPPLHNREQRAHAAEQSFLGVFKKREHHQRVRVKYHGTSTH